MGSCRGCRKMSKHHPTVQGINRGRAPQTTGSRTRFSITNLSIGMRLPLLVGILIFGVLVASVWAAFNGVKESAAEAGRERLTNLTQQLAGMTQQSAGVMS